MKLRAATEADLAGIFAIYDAEVLHGTATFDTEPKTAPQRLEWFRDDGKGRYPILVAEDGGAIAGWARLYAWSNRCAYAAAAENAVYVHADWRGKGVGGRLLGELLRIAPERGVRVVIARVVEGNASSRALHEAHGFTTIGVMHRIGEKFGRLLDVRMMERHLDGEAV
ncbi:MAG TPA: GNAT family N-acetyltransferase [Verrucomicrobiae bacterium]|nr:GNAT family N-acetyltransferase [Verrucomicrobiae bacterium]